MKSKEKLTKRVWLSPVMLGNKACKEVIGGEYSLLYENPTPIIKEKIEPYVPFPEPLPYEFEEAEVRDRAKMYEEYFKN